MYSFIFYPSPLYAIKNWLLLRETLPFKLYDFAPSTDIGAPWAIESAIAAWGKAVSNDYSSIETAILSLYLPLCKLIYEATVHMKRRGTSDTLFIINLWRPHSKVTLLQRVTYLVRHTEWGHKFCH